jgi:AAA15 family ATPase/GTPase
LEDEEEIGSIADYFERLVMELQLPGGAKYRTVTRLALEGNRPRLKFNAARITDHKSALFKGTTRNLGSYDAHRYSRLVKEGLESSILETARLIDDRIKDLSVLVDDDRPALYADIGFKYPMPVNLLGEGFNSLLSILFAATAVRDGVFLVDEVENGLHYSSLLALWRGLIPISRRFNVQVIATTHSWECIRAAHEAFEMSKEDLLLHRLENVEGSATAETYDYDMVSTALTAGLEMR